MCVRVFACVWDATCSNKEFIELQTQTNYDKLEQLLGSVKFGQVQLKLPKVIMRVSKLPVVYDRYMIISLWFLGVYQ